MNRPTDIRMVLTVLLEKETRLGACGKIFWAEIMERFPIECRK